MHQQNKKNKDFSRLSLSVFLIFLHNVEQNCNFTEPTRPVTHDVAKKGYETLHFP